MRLLASNNSYPNSLYHGVSSGESRGAETE